MTITNDYFPHLDLPTLRDMRKPAPVYLRFGYYMGDRSMNWSTGKYERGVSVYPAVLKDGVVYPHPDWRIDIFCGVKYGNFEDRSVWVVTGHEVCRGSDGEPILQGVTARKLAITITLYSRARGSILASQNLIKPLHS